MAQFAPPPAPLTPPPASVAESGSLSAPPAPAAPTAQAAPPVMQAAPPPQAAPPAPAAPPAATPVQTYDEPPAQEFRAPQAAPAQQEQAMVAAKQTLPVGSDGFPTGGSMAEVAAALGFEGVNFNVFGVIPNVTLSQGDFFLEKKPLGQEFLVRMGTSRKKSLLSYGPESAKELFYTYDMQTNANNGQSVEEFKAAAAEAGQQIRQSDYYEVSCTLDNGAIANLSIPIAGSGANFARLLAECFARSKRPQDVVVKVFRAPRVENVKFPFYPWGFEIVSEG